MGSHLQGSAAVLPGPLFGCIVTYVKKTQPGTHIPTSNMYAGRQAGCLPCIGICTAPGLHGGVRRQVLAARYIPPLPCVPACRLMQGASTSGVPDCERPVLLALAGSGTLLAYQVLMCAPNWLAIMPQLRLSCLTALVRPWRPRMQADNNPCLLGYHRHCHPSAHAHAARPAPACTMHRYAHASGAPAAQSVRVCWLPVAGLQPAAGAGGVPAPAGGGPVP